MITFLNPAAWLLAGFVAVLIALHRRDRTRQPFDVPSLLLWQSIPIAPPRAARVRPNWLLALQCLLLLSIVAALADPRLTDRPDRNAGGRTVFVLDASASMQAREGRETRFNLARDTLRQRLESLPVDDEVMLIAAGTQPTVVIPPTVDHAEALRRLAALEATDAAANLDATLTLASRAAGRGDRATRIELFTDTPHDRLAPAWHAAVSWFPVGESDDNVAVEGMQVFQGRFDDPRNAHAYVAVRNFARREAHGVLTLRLDDAVVSRLGFTLAPRSVGGFPLRALPGPGVLSASLEVDDALDADNLDFALVRAPRALRLLAVTDSPRLRADLQRLADATHGLDITTVASPAYRGADAADIVLFHRVAPQPPEGVAALYLAPEDPGGPFPSRGVAHDLPVIDWLQGHPILRGVRPDLPFRFSEAQIIDAPAWSEVLLTSRGDGGDVPLAFSGIIGEQRLAVLTFDPSVEGLLSADRVDLLVLLLNVIDWLGPRHDTVRVISTGTVEVVDGLPEVTRRIIDPRGGVTELPASDAAMVDARLAGPYTVSANGTSVRLFAALHDPEESDIGRPAAAPRLVAAPPAPAAAPRPDGGGPFAAWLLAGAALLLASEWLVARRAT